MNIDTSGVAAPIAHERVRLRKDASIAQFVSDGRSERLTYLSGAKLQALAHLCHRYERDGIGGVIVVLSPVRA